MTKKFTPSYTVGDILELYRIRSNDGDEGRIRDLATTFRSLTRLDHAVSIPGQYKVISKEVRTPFIRDAWHRISSSLCAKQPVVHLTPKDDRKAEYRNASSIAERFDLAMIERINKELGQDIVYNLTSQLVRDGSSVLKVVHRKQAWANFPKRSSDMDASTYNTRIQEYKHGVDLPIAWRDVDRLSVVYEGGEYGDDWIIEYGEYTKPFIKASYGMVEGVDGHLSDPKHIIEGRPYIEGLNPSSTGRTVKLEFFDCYEWHVIIDGVEAPGFPKANPYAPYLPYFRSNSYDSESLLYSLMFLVPRLDELLTMKLNWAHLGAYPNPVLETINTGNIGLEDPFGSASAGEGTGGRSFTWEPGKLIELPLGKSFKFVSPPPVGADLNQLAVLFKSLIDIAGVPSIMRGAGFSGESGYLGNQLKAAADMAYRLAAISSQRQLEKALEFTHWLIDNVIKQTVYVMGWTALNPKTYKPPKDAALAWLGLSPTENNDFVAQISKLGPVSVQYRPTLPTDDQARAMIAMQMVNAKVKLSDRRHALETWMQEEDPDAIMDAIYVEESLEEEPLRSLVHEEALRQAGLLPPQQPPAPTPQLVDQFGQPMMPQGPGNLGPSPVIQMPGEPVPQMNNAPPGVGGVPGLTIPAQPGSQGVPGAPGGRPPGFYPGMPSNQGQ